MNDVSLSIFETPLLRLILCGGGGLPPACGPLVKGEEIFVWHPEAELTISDDVMFGPVIGKTAWKWTMPLDGASPWPDRLAMVAARMLDIQTPFAQIKKDWPRLHLQGYGFIGIFWEGGQRSWSYDGGGEQGGGLWLDSLPQYMNDDSNHPSVALVRALYDVPKIRARVEAL